MLLIMTMKFQAQRAEVIIEIESENSEKCSLTDCGSEDGWY